MQHSTYRIPASVSEAAIAFRRAVEAFAAGETTAAEFRPIAASMGVYEQRGGGTYMVRLRGPAGVYLPHQLIRAAELAEEFGDHAVHFTTRQDLQIHGVPIQSVPIVVEHALEVGLASIGGGGNTVRNVSACPYAGICPSEAFDVTPHALALTEYLLESLDSFTLPRKFKVAFSGCGRDCAMCSVADLGFFAHERDGAQGFSVYAAGGMGAISSTAVLLEEFISTERMFEVAEAVKRLFDKHGDRANRARARLRFVLQRLGESEFLALYREELESVRREGPPTPRVTAPTPNTIPSDPATTQQPDDPAYHAWEARNVVPQKQKGPFAVRMPLPHGNATSRELRELCSVTSAIGDGAVRATQDQCLQLRGIRQCEMHDLFLALRGINALWAKPVRVRVLRCVGASVCRIGLRPSRELAEAIEAELAGTGIVLDEPIRISGCHNSCAQHPVAPIGFYGIPGSLDGQQVPRYTMVVGGRAREGDALLAQVVAKIPADAIPALLRELLTALDRNRSNGESISDAIVRIGPGCVRSIAGDHASV